MPLCLSHTVAFSFGILMTMTPIENKITLPHGTVHYWTYHPDKQPVILMIHGFRGTHHGLEKLIAELPDFKVIVPDLPGFGDTPAMRDHAHTIENYSHMLREFIKELNLQNPILFGHSMGSIIAADMIAADPTITPRVVFVNPIATRPTEGLGAIKIAPGIAYHHLAGRILPEAIGMRILRNKMLFLVGSASMTKTKDKELRKWIHWNHVTYMKRFSDRKSLLEAYDSSSNTTIRDYATKLELPILMIAGKKDAIAPIKGQRSLASALKDATLIELDNVGHIVHYEKPAEAGEAIRQFLRR